MIHYTTAINVPLVPYAGYLSSRSMAYGVEFMQNDPGFLVFLSEYLTRVVNSMDRDMNVSEEDLQGLMHFLAPLIEQPNRAMLGA